MEVRLEASGLAMSPESLTQPLSFLSHQVGKPVRVVDWNDSIINADLVDRSELLVCFVPPERSRQMRDHLYYGTTGHRALEPATSSRRSDRIRTSSTFCNALLLDTGQVVEQTMLSDVVQCAIPVLADFFDHEVQTAQTPEFLRSITRGIQRFFQTNTRDEQVILAQAQEKYENLRAEMYETNRTIIRARAIVNSMQFSEESLVDGRSRIAANRLASLVDTGVYKRIRITEDNVEAETGHIDILWQNYAIPMGTYKVYISLSTGRLTVRAVTLSHNSPNGYTHPHLSSGDVCWGNLSVEASRAQTRGNWGDALMYAHALLQSYYPDNPYIVIGRFSSAEGVLPSELMHGPGDEDRCEGCDDRNSPYCIFSCDHNEDGERFTSDDCCDYGNITCYTTCDHNADHCCISPCDNCDYSSPTVADCMRCQNNPHFMHNNPCRACTEEYVDACRACEFQSRVDEAVRRGVEDARPTEERPDDPTDSDGPSDSGDSGEEADPASDTGVESEGAGGGGGPVPNRGNSDPVPVSAEASNDSDVGEAVRNPGDEARPSRRRQGSDAASISADVNTGNSTETVYTGSPSSVGYPSDSPVGSEVDR